MAGKKEQPPDSVESCLPQSRKRIDRNTTIAIRFSLRSSASLVEPVDWEELIRTRFTSHPRQLAQSRFCNSWL
jgi:hypothetical protein